MDLSCSNDQSSSFDSLFSQRMIAFDELSCNINNFLVDCSLEGKCYISAKEYFKSVVLTLVDGQKLLWVRIREGIDRLPNEYINSVDSKSWEEDELIILIQKEQKKSSQLRGIAKLEKLLNNDNNITSRVSTNIKHHDELCAMYNRILNDLRTYNEMSNSFFDSVSEVRDNLNNAIASTSECFNKNNNMFEMPSNMEFIDKQKKFNLYIKNKNGTDNLMKIYGFDSTEKKAVSTLMKFYGFDEYTSQQIVLVRHMIDERYPNDSTFMNDYRFFRVIGGCYYNQKEWDIASGDLQHCFDESDSKSVFTQELRIPGGDKLYYNIRLNNFMSSQDKIYYNDITQENKDVYFDTYKEYYGGNSSESDFEQFWNNRVDSFIVGGKHKGDFAHFCITNAAYMHDSGVGDDFVDKCSGLYGDMVLTDCNDAGPSINDADFNADLDSQNTYSRYQSKKYNNCLEVINEYYEDVKNDETKKIDEYLMNVDFESLKKDIENSSFIHKKRGVFDNAQKYLDKLSERNDELKK